jgi:hypothetical protein
VIVKPARFHSTESFHSWESGKVSKGHFCLMRKKNQEMKPKEFLFRNRKNMFQQQPEQVSKEQEEEEEYDDNDDDYLVI